MLLAFVHVCVPCFRFLRVCVCVRTRAYFWCVCVCVCVCLCALCTRRVREAVGRADPGNQTAQTIEIAVGLWHLLPHVPRCHVMYNPNYIKGAAMTAGDCVEHIWAILRRFSARLAYMGDGQRQDIFTLVVSSVRMGQGSRVVRSFSRVLWRL